LKKILPDGSPSGEAPAAVITNNTTSAVHIFFYYFIFSTPIKNGFVGRFEFDN